MILTFCPRSKQQSTLFAIWTRVIFLGKSNSRESHSMDVDGLIEAAQPLFHIPSIFTPSKTIDAGNDPAVLVYIELWSVPTIAASSSTKAKMKRNLIHNIERK